MAVSTGAAVTEEPITATKAPVAWRLRVLPALILLAEVLQAVLAAEPGTGPADDAVAQCVVFPSILAVTVVGPTRIGICTICIIRSVCSCSSSADAYCHATAHECTAIKTSTISATAIDATMINACMINACMVNGNASSIGEGVSRNRRSAVFQGRSSRFT